MTGQEIALAGRRPPLIALALAAAALLLALGAPGAASRNGKSSVGRAVQSLVDDGWFEVAEGARGREIILRPDPASERADPARVGIVGEIHRLGDYMRTPDYWQIDANGRVVAFDVNDSVPGPFDDRDTWSGAISYGRVPQVNEIPLVRLADPRGRIVLTADSGLRLVRGALWPRLDVSNPDREPVSGGVFELMCGSEPGALVYRIADAVVVNARGRGRCNVRVGEQRLGDGSYCRARAISAARCAFGVLRPGDVLALSLPDATGAQDEQGGRVIARYQRRAPPSTAMVMRRNANLDKIPAPGLAMFVNAVARDLGAAMIGCGTSGTSLTLGCEDNLPLSLDFELQREVQSHLDQDRADHVSRRAPSTAAVVVMNTRSGEVLAMGGYQSPESPTCPMPALCLLPVGSTAKPVFATAMIGAFEGSNLATLHIRHRGTELSDILGLRFHAPVNNENSGTRIGDAVGLEQFLQHSDNHYAETLLLLASALPDGGRCPMAADDWYEIDGARVTGSRARSSFENERCEPLRRGYQAPFRPHWAGKLTDYFALNPFSRETQDSDTLCSSGRLFGNLTYDSMPWHAIFLPDASHCQMLNSGLQRNWMGVERMRDFRTEAVPMLLGNNGGHWTAVKLAEAYARLATGQAVRASFVYSGGKPVSQHIDFRNGNVDARIAVSAGLAKVLLGTAASSAVPAAVADLQTRLAQHGYRLGAFAKTGTMQLTGAMAGGCSRRRASAACVGKAFVITLAVYPAGATSPVLDATTGRAIDAAATPRCAVTLVVNLPRWNDESITGNAAANFAATLIRGTIATRLLELDGPYCGPRS
ncbi:MAG: hypothetical protein V4475_11905 [Pseudomonadota bacterium]